MGLVGSESRVESVAVVSSEEGVSSRSWKSRGPVEGVDAGENPMHVEKNNGGIRVGRRDPPFDASIRRFRRRDARVPSGRPRSSRSTLPSLGTVRPRSSSGSFPHRVPPFFVFSCAPLSIQASSPPDVPGLPGSIRGALIGQTRRDSLPPSVLTPDRTRGRGAQAESLAQNPNAKHARGDQAPNTRLCGTFLDRTRAP
eukprot:scaffold324_cov326-Pavlova_lutheri.AAC.28